MMKIDAPSDPRTPEVEPHFGDRLRLFWERYASAVYIFCCLIAIAIVAKGIIDYLAVQRELAIQKEFAACTTLDSYKAFATEHPRHPLAALVDMRSADESYAAGRFGDAAGAYERALAILPAGPFQARARLGLAISRAQAGSGAEAEAGLRQIVNDESELKAIRCEAGYHLAVLAVASGRVGDVQKLAEQLMQIDPSSPFAERAFQLRGSLPGPAAPASPSVSLPSVRTP
jgi:hypothetical protein